MPTGDCPDECTESLQGGFKLESKRLKPELKRISDQMTCNWEDLRTTDEIFGPNDGSGDGAPYLRFSLPQAGLLSHIWKTFRTEGFGPLVPRWQTDISRQPRRPLPVERRWWGLRKRSAICEYSQSPANDCFTEDHDRALF